MADDKIIWRPYLIVVTVAVLMDLRAGERMLEAVVLLEVLVAQRYPLVVDINSQAALAILQGSMSILKVLYPPSPRATVVLWDVTSF